MIPPSLVSAPVLNIYDFGLVSHFLVDACEAGLGKGKGRKGETYAGRSISLQFEWKNATATYAPS